MSTEAVTCMPVNPKPMFNYGGAVAIVIFAKLPEVVFRAIAMAIIKGFIHQNS
jgi:hypothetical protein